MARPREFDTNEALTAAMHSFWEHGYESTSVSDLLEAMHLQKGSLYKAFGSKHELFIDSLRIYINEMKETTVSLLMSQSTPTAAIRAWVEQKSELCRTDECGKGCLFMNTLIELASEDNEVRTLLLEYLQGMMSFMVGIIEKGQKAGEFRDDIPAEQLAGLLAIHASGLYVIGRGRIDFLKKHSLTDLVMEILLP